MTLPVVPGSSMSFSQINTELGLTSTATISLNDAAVRTLAGVGASPATISITNLSGKANQFAFTISSNQTNANLRTLAVNAGWNQSSKVVATINSGVQISSTSTGTPALTINGSFPGTVQLINNGVIVGRGGAGGRGGDAGGAFANGFALNGGVGGTGLSVSVAVTVNNASGTISGGGGGGGGGGFRTSQCESAPGAGGGGGNGYGTGAGPGNGPYPFGVPGTGGTGGQLSGGGGGSSTQGFNNSGGAGGSFAAGGGTGGRGDYPSGGYGGSGGSAISGNGNITYISTGTRYGAVG